ncbi:MAG TPA: GNAT family N-acetyltransferase [Microlunatus sp.]
MPEAAPARPQSRPEPQLRYASEERGLEYLTAVVRGFHEDYQGEYWEELNRRWPEWDRSFGFTVGDRWVATCAANTRTMTVPGGTVPTAGVTVVTVSADHRRRGLLTAMMKHQLEDVARRHEPVALLWASESLIYGRFGYGSTAPRLSLSGQTRALAFRPSVDLGDGWIEEVTPQEYAVAAPLLHARLLPDRPGALNRTQVWWDRVLHDPKEERNGASSYRFALHRSSAGDVDGYAQYRVKPAWEPDGPADELRINELDAANGPARAAVWRHLLDLDLVRTFTLEHAPIDEPLRYLVADQRAVRSQLYDSTYVRIVDVPGALEARRYATDLDVVVEIRDGLLPRNNARFRVGATAGGAVEVRRVRRKPDLSLDIRELGAGYLGGVSLRTLVSAGLVEEHTSGSAAAMTMAFESDQLPFCPDHF